jgi:hypothetical protein
MGVVSGVKEQVRRNPEKFPDDFMFELTTEEKTEVVANCVHLSKIRFSPYLPYAFTERKLGVQSGGGSAGSPTVENIAMGSIVIPAYAGISLW